ncbi:UvrD-helicase domain-containing protein [Solirubrobacter phytolaccae]|uniref:ATP-dependent DNA helicase UvrD1 n=1 Tax=Solirubrobacter phytolaccae TaxID=1404360 RepID=A0A9X3SF02_9ACTN|nr:UvrD-helicase domain-containing protein [Solirubrobacter phytolaccae]MDA0180932.1 UvrD-helicase domain-containing protein [Solirubrobacter phytolaccae]
MPADAVIDDLLEGLNPPQRDAVTHGEGPMLILAGAGSGKTRVITHRIAYLLRTGQARPSEILAITFTNKAAAEMRERVELLVGRVSRAMWVMTFHAACARMLRAHADKLGFTRQFTIYDTADQRRLIKHCLDNRGYDTKRYTPRALQSQISNLKNQLISPFEYGETVGSPFEEIVAEIYHDYGRELLRMNAMDFDDMLVNSVELLQKHQDVRDNYARQFRWVMVDEYQDTNKVQYRWLQLLTAESRNLAVVGDDAQSIYSFRSADIRNILEFEEDYPDAHVVKLEQNYRSTQTILDAANALIAHNRGQMPKHLWTDLGEGDPVRVREMADEHSEARWVTAEIQRLVDEGVSKSEIAVFYRTNAQARVLDEMLTRAGVGFQVIGGPKFYERAEVKDAIAYLTFLINPQDATAFTRIANSPRRGIGQTSLSRVLAYAASTGVTVWEAAESDETGLAKAARNALGRFMESMTELKARADENPPVAQLLDAVLHQTGYLDALHAERTIEAQGRIENLESLLTAASQYDMNAEDGGSLDEFLQQTSLFADSDNLRDDEGLVTLMTMHNAKGLEFPIVFMIGMEDGTFPHSRSIEESNLEEERRLAYVGLTRAMRQLTLTYARRRMGYGGGASATIKSRFLDELPRELTDQPARISRGFPGAGQVASWSQAAAASAEYAGGDTNDAQLFRVGDDVVHAQLGDGVVTGLQPGGIVVVRFAGEGRDRSLMADVAPIRKR